MTGRDAPTKPSIDWSHVHPDYNWLARDSDGEVWIYSDLPTREGDFWWASGGEVTRGKGFGSCTPGTCDWRDSLVQRPSAQADPKESPSLDLLPCPFCGGRAEQITIGDWEPSNEGGDAIVCRDCDASTRVEFGRKENLKSAWNRRDGQIDWTKRALDEIAKLVLKQLILNPEDEA